MQSSISHRGTTELITVIALLAGGCASLPSGIADHRLPSESKPGTGPVQNVVVEFHTGKKPQIIAVPWNPNMRIDDALRLSRATRKFPRMQVTLVRQAPNGAVQKMESRFHAATRRVLPEYDYALYPGDRVVVRRDPYGMLDKMVEDTLGPIARLHAARR